MAVVVIDTIKPKNQGTFPVVEAVDVKVTDSKRLDAALNDKANQSDVTALQTTVAGKASQSDLNALSTTVAGKQNALSTAQLAACNSGITSELVTQIGNNTTAIASKASTEALESLSDEVDGKADTSDLTAATTDLQAQIDNIVSGSTADSEVINARVGNDGTSYNTLKARLDAEKTETDAEITNYQSNHVIIYGRNFYNTSYNISGKWIGSNGAYNTEANSAYARIPVKGGDTITFCYGGATTSTSSSALGGYNIMDSNLNKIKSIKPENIISQETYSTYPCFSYKLPDNAAYFEITVKLGTSWNASSTLLFVYGAKIGDTDIIKSWEGKNFLSMKQINDVNSIDSIKEDINNYQKNHTIVYGDNFYNKTEDKITGKWIDGNGDYQTEANSAIARIPIDINETITFCYNGVTTATVATSIGGFNLLDSQLNKLKTIIPQNCVSSKTYETYPCFTIETENAAYLEFTLKLGTTWDASDDMIVVYGSEIGETNYIKSWEGKKFLSNGSNWSTKKWTVIGDSLTEKNNRALLNYYDYISTQTGINVVNMGVSGTGYKRGYEGDIAFYQRAANVPVDSDVVTIFGSGNDLALISDLGEPTDTGTSTICGCINTTIDTIIELIPKCSLGIVSPTPWKNEQPTADDSNNMAIYTEALRQICKIRSIPFLDLYHCSNLRPWTEEGRTACYSRDEGNGVHPDENGHKLIAPRFKAFLESLIM